MLVPGVGDGSNLCDDWIPDAVNLYEASAATAVVLWKGYDNPADVLAATAGSIECTNDLATAAHDLTEFIASLSLEPQQTLTVIAHSFGSIVPGAALADAGLVVPDLVVAGGPGVTVDDLASSTSSRRIPSAAQAPGDAIAELGVFGAARASPKFGGTRMSTKAPDHPPVVAHSRYFEPGSEALENMADVVTGHYSDMLRHRAAFPEIAGGLVAWALRMPVAPLRMAGRHYRGPGFRVLVNWTRLVELGASEPGNLVSEVLDEHEPRAALVRPPGGCGPAPPRRRGAPGHGQLRIDLTRVGYHGDRAPYAGADGRRRIARGPELRRRARRHRLRALPLAPLLRRPADAARHDDRGATRLHRLRGVARR